MDDKFILMNLEDERSKKIAEVMGNSTCKKILDYLSDVKEASQKDLSDALNIPMNTLEYNVKKLLDSGLVEKTKNFFWSVKGKKIPMYKLARKHIVISPKYSKPNLNVLKTVIPIILVFGVLFAFFAIQNIPTEDQNNTSVDIQKFKSEIELKNFIKENQISGRGYESGISGGLQKSMAESASATDSSAPTSGASDYSETNIQVQGVDEADIVKNDGKYIYAVTSEKIAIVDAYPAENMKLLSEINISNVQEIFVNNDKLVTFSTDYVLHTFDTSRCGNLQKCAPNYNEPLTKINIYDISDRELPKLEKEISVSGSYLDSRMIGDYVYVIANQYIYDDIVYPALYEDGVEKVIQAEDISYSDIKDYSYQFTTILGIDIDDGEISSETTLTGATSNIYVSQDNIYLTQYKYGGWYRTMEENEEKTYIQKISIDKLDIKSVADGEVPGNILNQFSMDEYDEHFRIATTSRTTIQNNDNSLKKEIASSSSTQNNVYVLDKNLDVVGELEGLAPGENIYSVRFMGEKAYVVTFKKVDPLFVISLEDPENPKVLGKLKIPGYSDYLHPYDENHIIGIGKDTEEAEYGDFAWYQGVKIAIFDVTDVENPIEMHKVIIGDRGTQSEALNDHKAFLFDREKELLVIPIQLYEILGEKTEGSRYGEFTFQGAHVYNINLDDGFNLKGRITHVTPEEELKVGYYYDYNSQIRRSLYMDETLYTISNNRIKANDLDSENLEEIKNIELLHEEQKYYVDEGIASRGVLSE